MCTLTIYRIRVNTTVQGHSVEGLLFAADASMGVIVLQKPQSFNFNTISISQITSFKVLAPASGEEKELPTGKIDTEALRQREAKAVADAKKAEASRGKGVTAEAQELFDHISRTYVSPTNHFGGTGSGYRMFDTRPKAAIHRELR